MADINDIKNETKQLKDAIAQLKHGTDTLTEAQRTLLQTVGLLGKQTSKEIEKSMAVLKEQLKILKEREGSEKEINEQISLNNKLRQHELDILQAKIREAQQFEQEYEGKKEEALREQNRLLEEQKRVTEERNKEIKAGADVSVTLALSDQLKALEGAVVAQDELIAGLEDRHDRITSTNKEYKKGEENSIRALLLQRKRKKDIKVADEGIQAGLKSMLKTMTGMSDRTMGFVQSFLNFKKLMDEEPLEDLAEGEERLTGMQQAVNKVKDSFEALGGEGALMKAAFAAVAISTLKWMKDFDKASSDFRKNTGIIDKGLMGVEQSVVSVQRANLRMGVTTDEAFAAQSALTGEMAAFTSMTEDARQKVLQATTVMGEFGVSAETSAQIFNKFSKGLGYDAQQLEKLSTQLMAVSESLKMPPQIIAEDFNQAASELMKYGDGMLDVFVGLEEQSKATGLGMQELLGIAKQFDTFEAAGTAVGRLNAILGGPYLNAIQMVYATEEERIKAMRESIQMSGRQFKDLDRFEQQAIATAAGIDDMSMAARLFGGTQSEFAETTMTMKEMQERAVKAQAVWDKFGQIFDTVAIALSPLVDIIGVLADVLLIMLNPLGEVARIFTSDADWIAGIGIGTTAVIGLTAALKGLGIMSNLTWVAITRPLLAFGAAFAVVSKALDWISNFSRDASGIIGALLGIAGAIGAIMIVATWGVGMIPVFAAMAALGVSLGGISGAMKSFHVGSGGPVTEQVANLKAGESKVGRDGSVSIVPQTGVDHIEDGTTIKTRENTNRMLRAGSGGSTGMTQQQGQQIISQLAALNDSLAAQEASPGDTDTPIILALDPAGLKVIAKGTVKTGIPQKATIKRLNKQSTLTITKAGAPG